MSTQIFDDEFREALWAVYEQKCFFHGGLIQLNDMEIDHIVPESLLASKNLATQLAAYGLPDTFDIRGKENLVPTCRNCNSRKTNRIIPVNQAIIFLGQIQDKLPDLEEEHRKNVKGVALNYVKVRAKNGIKSGRFTKEELHAALKEDGLIDFSVSIDVPSSKPNNPSVRFKNVKFSEQAALKVRNNVKLIDSLIFGLANGYVRMKTFDDQGKIFECRASRDLRLLFTIVDEDTLFILDVITYGRE